MVGTFFQRILSNDYRNWEFSFGPFDLVNNTKSPNFELAWIYQASCRCGLVLVVINTDLIVPGVLAIISVQFKMVQNCIRRIVRNAYEDMVDDEDDAKKHLQIDYSKIPRRYLFDRMKKAIEYHQAVVNLADEIESLFNMLVLTVFLASLFILCCIMYHASLVSIV